MGFLPLAAMQQGQQTSLLHSKLRQRWVEAIEFVNRLWLAHDLTPHESIVLKLTTVQFVNELELANKHPIHQYA